MVLDLLDHSTKFECQFTQPFSSNRSRTAHSVVFVLRSASVVRLCSLKGLCLGTDLSVDHRAIDGLDLRNLAVYHGPVLLLGWGRVDGVADEVNVFEVLQLRALGDLFPILDPVVRDVERVQFLERRDVVESLDLIVGEQSCSSVPATSSKF